MKVEDHILLLIVKEQQGKISTEEQGQLTTWLNGNAENREEYVRLLKVWEASSTSLNANINVDREWNHFKSKHFAQAKQPTKVIKLRFESVLRYAAAAVILLGMFAGIQYFRNSESYSTGAGERLAIQLADGSTVILGENSRLKVNGTFNWWNRPTELEGEAFFDISKNPDKAFTIEGEKTTTRVLGTSFHLIASETNNKIWVSEGKVSYSADGQSIILTRGEEGNLADNHLKERRTEDPTYDSWKSGKFVFENTPILEVLSSLQDYYVFSIPDLPKFRDLDCRFSGSFDQQPIEEVLEVISRVMGMEYHYENKVLHIQSFKCE